MKKPSRVRRKSWDRKLVTLAVASCFAADLYAANPNPALPYGPTVINGQVYFNYNGNLLQITNSSGAIINWQAFSIGAESITRFLQQSASSVVLNRVTGGNPSEILGKLQSQLVDPKTGLSSGVTGGQVFLINPSGVFFRPGSQVDVGGLVVSTLGLSGADFKDKRNRFTDVAGAGGIENQGKIATPGGGSIYLIAPSVTNSGIIRSDGGEIILAAGKSVEIVNANSPDLRVTIAAPDNQAVNLGEIIAQGGKVGIYAGLIRQSGVVNANTAVRGENGKIVFKATKEVTLAAGSSTTANGPTGGSISIQSDGGKATVAGVVEANGTQGKGGTIAVAGQQGVAVESTARVTANGTEGGSVTLTSAGGSVTIAAPVTANATVGRAGEVAVTAATTAALASTGRLSASGGLGSGTVSVKGSGGVTFDAGSLVQANGAAGGTVTVQADQGAVMAQGTIDATASDGVGGNVQVAALGDITLDIGSQILVGGRSGGTAKIQSSEGTLSASGLIDGQGNDGPGGQVWLLAPRVGLFREAAVNVSGLTGGGTVLVGGDFQGKNPDIQNAKLTYVGVNTLIVADAIQSGNGGKVIVWADDTTRFYGNISSRGGVASGNGGFTEVSGKGVLDFRGLVNLTAPSGAAGLLLLDPRDLDISTGVDNNHTGLGTEASPWVSSGGSSVLNVTTLETQLGLSAVRIQTGATGAANGDITVLNTVTAPANSNNLTLEAHNNIDLQANINFAASSGTLVLKADGVSSDGVGAILQNGGTLVMGAASSLQMSAGSGIGSLSNPILTTGLTGVAATTGTGGIFIQNSGSGSINITSITTATGGTINGLGTTTTAVNGGNISVTNLFAGGDIAVNGNVSTATATQADAGGNQTPSSGNITLTSARNITGNGQLITGGATLTGGAAAGSDSATSGSVTLNATAGTIGLSNANALQIGTAQRTGGGAGTDTSQTGNVVLNSSGEINNGTASTPLAFTLGAASGAATNTQGTLQATTTGGAVGKLFVTSASPFSTGAITTSGGSVSIATTGAGALLTATANIDTTNAGGTPAGASITLTADDMALTGGANSIKAGSGANTVILRPNATNRTINITGGSTGELDLSPTEIQTVSVAGGTLQLGSTGATGDINLNANLTSANVNAGTLKLLSGQNINITGGNDIGASGTEFNHHLNLTATGSVNITNGNVYLADNKNLTVVATGSVNIGGDTVQVGTTGGNTGFMSITGRNISMGSSGGPEFIAVTGSGTQTFIANGAGGTGQIDIINSANSTVSITTGSGTQTFDTTATTGGNGNLLIQSSNTGGANGNVLVKSATGAQTITLNGGLTVQTGGASSSATATSALSADAGQTINAKYVEVIGNGAALATINNDTTTGNASNQALTVSGVNGSGESVVVKALGAGGAIIQNGIAASTGQQNITVNGAGANLLRVIGTSGDATILANGTGVAGNQQNILINSGASNAIEIGNVTTGATTGTSSISGKNQTVTADTLKIRGGTVATKHSSLVNTGGQQTVTLAGTLTLTGGTAIGASLNCAPGTGGSCAFVSNNGTGLQHITANKIDMKGGDIGGTTGIDNSAGIFINNGNMQLDVGAGGLVMLGGDGDPTATTGGGNQATIGGSGANGRTLTLNVAGDTTLTGGTTENSSAFIGLGGVGSGQSVTVTFSGTTGDVILNGGAGLNAGAAIGAGRQQDNATTNVTITGKNITLTPGTVGGARIGHSALAVPGGGNISVTATGGDILLQNGGGAASYILTTGNVTLQASSAGKVISEQSGGYIGANTLTATADSGITLTGTGNAISSFAATNNSANAISLKNTGALDIAAGNITNTGRNVTLNNTGAVTDTGSISAAGLELLGAGPYTLDNASNSVTTLAANTSGAITYVNAGALTVGTVNTVGITTAANPAGNTGGVTLSTVAGDLIVSQAIATGAATVATTGSAVVNSGAISLTAGGTGKVFGTATVTAGSATVTGGVVGDTATVGNITISGNRVAQAAAGATPFAVAFNAANAGAGTSNQGRLNVTTDGVGAAGDIRVTSGTPLFTNTIAAADAGALVSIATTGGNNLTNVGTITGPGGISIDVGAGTFNNTSGTLTRGASAGVPITLIADAISIAGGTINAGTGNVTLTPGTLTNDIEVCNANCALGGTTDYDFAGLASITAGSFTIGRATHTGTISMQGLGVGFPTFPLTLRTANTTANAITVLGAFQGGAGASLTLDNLGVGGVANVNANVTAPAGFSTTGDVNLAANITTTNTDLTIGGNLVIASAATPTLSTGAGAGNILISGTSNGTTGGAAESLTVLAGTGNVTFTGNVGNNANATELEALTVTSAATTTFSGTIDLANALTQSAGSVATTFAGAVNVGSAALTGTAFNVNNSFASGGTTAFTNSGVLTKNATGNITSTGTFSTTGDVNLAANITTTNTDLTIGGNLVIAQAATPTLSTGAGAGNILVSGTTNGTAAGAAESLTVLAGLGNVTFTGNVGNNADAVQLEALTVTSAATTLFSGTIDLANALTQSAGSGTTTLTGAVSAGPVNLTANTGIVVSSTLAVTGGTALTLTSDSIDLNGGANSVTGTGTVLLQPTTNATSIAVGSGAGTLQLSAADIAALANTHASLTIGRAAGTHAIEIGTVTFTSPTTIQASGGGGGSMLVSGPVITNNNATLTLNTGAAGTVTINAAGDIGADGAVSITGGGGISTAGDITTTADNITFVSPTTLTGGGTVAINTAGTGGGTGDITFQSTLTGTTIGAENLNLTAGTSNILFTGAVGATRLGAVTVNSAANVTETAGLTAASVVQSAGTGTTLLTGAVNTNTATGVTLTTNNITQNGTITTTGNGVVTFTNAGLLTIAAAGDMNLDGAFTQNGAGVVSTAGDITTTNDNVSFLRAVTLTGGSVLSAGSGNITFSNTLDGGFNLTANSTANTTFTGAVGNSAPLASLTTNALGDTFVDGGLVKTSGNQTYGDKVTISTATTFNATNATATVSFNAPVFSLSAGANALTINADEIDFTGGADSIRGTGSLLLQPNNPAAAINIGTAATANVGDLDLTTADLDALKSGFTAILPARPITVGQAAGTHAITIGDATFKDAVLLQAPNAGGQITVQTGKTLNAPNIDFKTPGFVAGGGTVAGNSLTIIQSGGIGTTGNPLLTKVNFLEAANSGSGDVYIQNDRDITLQNQFRNNVANKVLWLETTNGSINTGTAVVSIAGGALGQIVLTAHDAGVAGGANITVGTGGIASNGGKIALHAADNINVNGGVVSSNGNIEIIAGARGNVGGGSTWVPGLLNGTLTLPATEAASDGIGLITLNAPVNAGATGDVVLISATVNNTGAVPQTEIIQTATGVITGNNLTAVALRGTGGQFNGGGGISLNAANNPTLNSAANVSLFACPEAGCPSGVNPFATAPMIFDIGPLNPPLVNYADGPIFYTSASTNISGVGTVNDFIFYNNGGFTLTGSTMFGRKLTFETNGTIDINLASQITNATIQTGGFLRFVAGNSINYNPSALGNTFGAPGVPLSRDVQFVAGNSIDINNAMYIGPSGSVTIDAFRNIHFASPPSPPLGPPCYVNVACIPANYNNPGAYNILQNGAGLVQLRGNHEVAVGGNLTLNANNLSVLGGNSDVNSQVLGQRLNVTGTATLNVAGNILVQASTESPIPGGPLVSDSAAIIQGGTINIGSAGARANSLTLTGGTTTVTAGTSQVRNADARIVATGSLNGFLGAGGLTLTGGTATVTNTATNAGQASAAANLTAGNVVVDVTGNALVAAGTATAQGGLSALGTDVGADASASIIGLSGATIGGTLSMLGGTATATSAVGARALARTLVSGSALNLTVNNTGNLVDGMTMTAGTASATGTAAGSCAGAGGVCAFADARLLSTADTTINVAKGNILLTGGTNANASGANAIVTASAVSDSGSVTTLATVLTVNASAGSIKLTGGNQYVLASSGIATATAGFQSTGHIKLTAGFGTKLTGSSASGVYQNLGGTLQSLLGLAGQAVETAGGYTLPAPVAPPAFGVYTAINGVAFVLSGAPPSNLDPLQAALLSSLTALNTKFGGASVATSSSSTKPNYCK